MNHFALAIPSIIALVLAGSGSMVFLGLHNSPRAHLPIDTPTCDTTKLRVGDDVVQVRRVCGLPSRINYYPEDEHYQWCYNIYGAQSDYVYVTSRGDVETLQPPGPMPAASRVFNNAGDQTVSPPDGAAQ